MDSIKILTLVDITATGINRPTQGQQLSIDQQRNFITLLQCAELRSVVHYDEPPVCEEQDISDLGFGSKYKGNHKVWTFTFTPDRESVYRDSNGDDLGYLINDINLVPVIKNLTETINIDKAVFDVSNGENRNTVVMAISGNSQAN
jgi:hypothetical protein